MSTHLGPLLHRPGRRSPYGATVRSWWRLVVVASMLAALAACGIPADDSPRDVALEQRSLNLSASTGAAATGSSRIYLVAPSAQGELRQLRAVNRDVAATAGSAAALLQVLFQGPNDAEIESGVTTFLPADVRVIDTTPVGEILFVELTDEIDELSSEFLEVAIAQIVYTIDEIDGISSVRIRVDGQDRAWPAGDGIATERSLTIYDYPSRVATSQPAFPAIPSPEA